MIRSAHGARRVGPIDTPESVHSAEPRISRARCRELLGSDAEHSSDEEIDQLRQHAAALALAIIEAFDDISPVAQSWTTNVFVDRAGRRV